MHCTLEPEPFGRVILESLSQGCDVICHKNNGCLEVLKNSYSEGFGYLSGVVDESKYCLLDASKVDVSYP